MPVNAYKPQTDTVTVFCGLGTVRHKKRVLQRENGVFNGLVVAWCDFPVMTISGQALIVTCLIWGFHPNCPKGAGMKSSPFS